MPSEQSAPGHGSAATVTVRYFAGARAAAGVASEPVDLRPGGTVDDVLALAADRHGPVLDKVLSACSVLLDEVAVRDRSVAPRPGSVLDVLPPFAGG